MLARHACRLGWLSDPLTVLYDIIELQGITGDDARYLLRRLAISLGDERAGVETFESMTRRTFGYYQRLKASPEDAVSWLQQRKATLSAVLSENDDDESLPWQDELAAKTGASPRFITALAAAYENAPVDALEASTWLFWLLDQLDPKNRDADIFLRQDSMVRVFGRAISSQSDEVAARAVALQGTRLALESWFAGKTLCEMEDIISGFIAKNEGAVSRPTRSDSKAILSAT